MENQDRRGPIMQPITKRRRSIGKYKIERELGKGGMGVVFYAIDKELGREVALKILNVGSDLSKDDRERFEIEIKASAKLNHPNIVKLYEAGIEEGQRYFAMEYIKGCDLKNWVINNIDKDGALRESLKIVLSIAKAIAYAHSEGIIHRDLKPQNILIDNNNVPKIVDFGLAKAIDSDSFMTVSGQVLGTPSYMSPEQAQGKSKLVNELSDVYSLGAILYEVVTGIPPFTGDKVIQIMADVCSNDPAPPLRNNLPVAEDIKTIIEKAMEKDPARRYQSAIDLAKDIDRFINGQIISAKRASLPYKLKKKILRNKPLFASLSLLFIGFIILLSYFIKIKVNEAERLEIRRNAIEIINSAKNVYMFEEYIKQVLKATEVDPNWEIPYIEAASKLWIRDKVKTIEYLNKAKQINPKNPSIYYYLTLIYFYDNNAKKMNEAYQLGMQYAQKGEYEYNKLNAIYSMLNHKYNDALHYIDLALKTSPNNTEIIHQRNRIFNMQADTVNYIKGCNQLAEIDPGYKVGTFYGAYYLDITEYYFKIKQYDNAMETIDKALILDNTKAWPYYYKAIILNNRGKTLDAIKYFKIYISKKNPSDYSNQYHYIELASLYMEIKDLENTHKYIDLAKKTKDSPIDVIKFTQAKLYYLQGDYDKSIELMNEIINYPFAPNMIDLSTVYNYMGLNYSAKGNDEKQLEYFQKAYEYDHNNEIGMFNYVKILLKYDGDKACRIIMDFYKNNKSTLTGRTNIVDILIKQKNYAEIVAIEPYISRDLGKKDKLVFLYNIGILLFQDKQYKYSAEIFKKNIKENDKKPFLYVLLGASYEYGKFPRKVIEKAYSNASNLIHTESDLNSLMQRLQQIALYNIAMNILKHTKLNKDLETLSVSWLVRMALSIPNKRAALGIIIATYDSPGVRQETKEVLLEWLAKFRYKDYFLEYINKYKNEYGETPGYAYAMMYFYYFVENYYDAYPYALKVVENTQFKFANMPNSYIDAIYVIMYNDPEGCMKYIDYGFKTDIYGEDRYFYMASLAYKKQKKYRVALDLLLKALDITQDDDLKTRGEFMLDSLKLKAENEENPTSISK